MPATSVFLVAYNFHPTQNVYAANSGPSNTLRAMAGFVIVLEKLLAF